MAQDIKSRGPKGNSSEDNNTRYSRLVKNNIMNGKKTPLQVFTESIDSIRNKLKDAKNMKKGGKVKKTKSHRGDGIAKRGRTRGRIV